jgi:hypothetical protein
VPGFISIAEPSIITQNLYQPTVETSVVTRRRFVSVPPLRDRLVCIAQTREVDIVGADRLVAVDVTRAVAIVGATRRVTFAPLSLRVVVIPPEETCCE